MNTSKYLLLLSLMILFPLFAVGQIRNITKREAEQLEKNAYYVTSNGEVTKVVYTVSGLDDSEYSAFLKTASKAEIDSILSTIKTDYTSLEDAVLDIDGLLREVDSEKKQNFEGNKGLSFKISQRVRNLRKKEDEAARRAEELLSKDPTVEELTAVFIEFGDKPTYYINGVEVPHNLVNQLYPNEVVKKELRTTDTASGNPNGEIWYLVTDKALRRIKIPAEFASNFMSNSPIVMPSSPREKTLDLYLQEKERVKVKSELKTEPVVRRILTSDGRYQDVVVTKEDAVVTDNYDGYNNEGAVGVDSQERNADITSGATRVLSRTINNEDASLDPNDPVARALRNRRSQPVFRQNNRLVVDDKDSAPANPLYQTEDPAEIEARKKAEEARKKVEENVEKELGVSKETPKKSVRRIKARQQSQYQD